MITFFCSKLPVYICAFICFIDNCQERKAALRAWAKRLEAECEALEKALAEVKIEAEEKKKRAEERKKAGLPENDGPGGEGSYQRPKRMYGRSDFRGVYRSDSNKWMARITVAGKKLSLGSFSTEIAAAQAYDGACVLRGIQKSLSLFLLLLPFSQFLFLSCNYSGLQKVLRREKQAQFRRGRKHAGEGRSSRRREKRHIPRRW